MNFYSIFPDLKNIDLIKDVGLTPHYLAKYYKYNSTIICFDNDEYNNLEKVNELDLIIFKKKHNNVFLNYLKIYSYIIKNAKNIDVLNCYHLTIYTIITFFIYKIFNRSGFAYFIFDMTYDDAKIFTKNKNVIYSVKRKVFISIFKHYIDLATISTKNAHNVLINYNETFNEKLLYIPVFIDLNPNIKKEKKNQIISVARIGTEPKASDIILESFKLTTQKLNNKNWILKMVGPISQNFKEYIDNFFKENPELKDLIIFTGNIEDRNSLFELYSESKIFLLPSRYESFGIVFPEALYYDNYLLVSDVGISKYLINLSDFGQLVEIDDVEDISNKLIYTIENYDNFVENKNIDLKKLINDEFSFKKYIKKINRCIKNKK